jgi:uncharacterized protein (TIGR00369 family)
MSSLLQQWKLAKAIPGGRWLLSQIVGWVVPYTGSLGISLESIEEGSARVAMRDRRALRNHLSCLHAVALVNLGELATGLALSTIQPKDGRWIVTRMEADYLRKARGTVRAECQLSKKEWENNGQWQGEAAISDESGEVVCRIRVFWKIGRRAPSGAKLAAVPS